MTRSARVALGAASGLPALASALLPPLTEAAERAPGGALAVAASLALLATGLGVVLTFVWIAAGMEDRTGGWRLAWVVALTLFGVVSAPAFWALYLRRSPATA